MNLKKVCILCTLVFLLLSASCGTNEGTVSGDTQNEGIANAGETSTSNRDFPAGEERLSLLVENDDIWVQLSDKSTGQSSHELFRNMSIVLTVYTQDGAFIQDISYGTRMKADEGHLIDIIRDPDSFVVLEDCNNDGAADLKVMIDGAVADPKWHTFLWDGEKFVSE